MHWEEHYTARSFETNKPIGVQLLTGSITTWTGTNPSFRVIEVDEETMLPVKVHTHVFDIVSAEKKWKWDHELTEYYNMDDLSP